MTKKYKPQWFESPFQHIVYTLCRTKKEIKKTGFKPTESKADANTTFYTNGSGTAAIVLLPKNKEGLNANYALLTHEAIHIWQEIKLIMGEDCPSKEFEAYSVQRIAQDLFHLYEVSNGRLAQFTT